MLQSSHLAKPWGSLVTDPIQPIRICSVLECDRPIRSDNKVGVCKWEHPGTDGPGKGIMYGRARGKIRNANGGRRAYLADYYVRKPEKRERNRKYHQDRDDQFREWIGSIKLAAGCADCGYAENAVALDFDHVRGVKISAVSLMAGRQRKLVEEEIAKCEVVCANHHRIRTFERGQHTTSD